MATVTTTAVVDLAELSKLLGVPATITNGADPLGGGSKIIFAPMDQDAMTKIVATYVYFNPATRGHAELPSSELLQPFAARATAVAAGSDTFTAGEIQQILAAVVRSQTIG